MSYFLEFQTKAAKGLESLELLGPLLQQLQHIAIQKLAGKGQPWGGPPGILLDVDLGWCRTALKLLKDNSLKLKIKVLDQVLWEFKCFSSRHSLKHSIFIYQAAGQHPWYASPMAFACHAWQLAQHHPPRSASPLWQQLSWDSLRNSGAKFDSKHTGWQKCITWRLEVSSEARCSIVMEVGKIKCAPSTSVLFSVVSQCSQVSLADDDDDADDAAAVLLMMMLMTMTHKKLKFRIIMIINNTPKTHLKAMPGMKAVLPRHALGWPDIAFASWVQPQTFWVDSNYFASLWHDCNCNYSSAFDESKDKYSNYLQNSTKFAKPRNIGEILSPKSFQA